MEFISDPITPSGDTLDTAAMARGEPGMPAAFTWRKQTLQVVEELSRWKTSAAEGGRSDGERYLRRHYYKLRMSDDSCWTVYFLRQSPKSGSPRQRWFLYSREPAEPTS